MLILVFREGNFVIYLSLKKQLHDLFEKCVNLILAYRFTRSKISPLAIEDIFDWAIAQNYGWRFVDVRSECP